MNINDFHEEGRMFFSTLFCNIEEELCIRLSFYHDLHNHP